jgi:aspartate/methionine/tyrosine aminotransferase
LCANSICQYAFFKALTGPKDHIGRTNDKLRRRRDISYRLINEIDGLSVRRPGGAFYMFPRIDCLADGPWNDDRDFVLDLLREEKVLTVFGSGFGEEYGAGHFRIVILPEEEVLESAFAGMDRFIRRRTKGT